MPAIGMIEKQNGLIDGFIRVRHDLRMSHTERSPAYIWFDLEFTDLDPSKACLLQVAMLATHPDLLPLQPGDQGLNLCLKLPNDVPVSEWVEQNLSDLLTRCRSEQAIEQGEAARQIMDYMDRVIGPPAEDIKQRPVLAGNSVHNDWRLACRHYPQFIERLHYRLLDVTALKLHWQDWLHQPEFDKEQARLVQEYLPFEATSLAGQPHDAHYDILASIAELNFYRQRMLKQP